MRRLGLSYGEIMDLVPVKKSTLATWCRDIDLTREQVAAIKERRAPDPGRRVAGVKRDTNWKRRHEVNELQAVAREIAGELALIHSGLEA